MKKGVMKSQNTPFTVAFSDHKHITRDQLNSLLNTYNCFYADQENLQLHYGQTEVSSVVIEGVLDVLWGVQHPIHFKIQDEKYIPPFLTLKSPVHAEHGSFPGKRGMIRWGEFDNLHDISEEASDSAGEDPNPDKGPSSASDAKRTLLHLKNEHELSSPFLPRTMSDASMVEKRKKLPTIARKEVETHRFSINGHFYNYQTSVFTPAYGSATKIRINSNMKTNEVIELMLHKFKGQITKMAEATWQILLKEKERSEMGNRKMTTQIENDPSEFALYIIHATGEKKQLKSTDVPLLERLFQGPSRKVAQFFLMDRGAEEVTSDVAQYIHFPVPLLQSILRKLNEEEEREIQGTIAKYHKEKDTIKQYLQRRIVFKTETAV